MKAKLPFYIFGAGGHAKCVVDAARLMGIAPDAAMVDDPSARSVLGVPIFTPADLLRGTPFLFTVAIGDCAVRRARFETLLGAGGVPQTVIHPRAFVSSCARVGEGSVVFANAALDPDVTVGANCILNLGCVVGHDCRVGAHSHVSGNCSLSGGSILGEEVWFGIGSCTIQQVRIGERAMIGAGSVVTRDIPADVIARGSPAHRCMRVREIALAQGGPRQFAVQSSQATVP